MNTRNILKKFFSENLHPRRDKVQMFRNALLKGEQKYGVYLNSHSGTVTEMLSNVGFDWLLIDAQHGANSDINLQAQLAHIDNGNCVSLVRVGGATDTKTIQSVLDYGAGGVMCPIIKTADDAKRVVEAVKYPTQGTRSVYFPQRCMHRDGLLDYAFNANKNTFVLLQIETKEAVENIDEILAVEGVDCAFLGPNDLCLQMGLFEKYVFPDMYFSSELKEAQNKILAACKKNNVIPGVFLFGTDRVKEYVDMGFNFVSVGNDLSFLLSQSATFVNNLENLSKTTKFPWTRTPTKLH